MDQLRMDRTIVQKAINEKIALKTIFDDRLTFLFNFKVSDYVSGKAFADSEEIFAFKGRDHKYNFDLRICRTSVYIDLHHNDNFCESLRLTVRMPDHVESDSTLIAESIKDSTSMQIITTILNDLNPKTVPALMKDGDLIVKWLCGQKTHDYSSKGFIRNLFFR